MTRPGEAAGDLPGDVLQRALTLMKEQNSRVSIRFLAEKLTLSAPYLTRVLKNQTPFPVARFDDFVTVFRLDVVLQDELLLGIQNAVLMRTFDGHPKLLKRLRKRAFRRSEECDSSYSLVPPKAFDLVSKWYHLAILDLTTCENFVSDSKWIAKRLNLPLHVTEEALNSLVAKGFLMVQEGVLKKKDRKIRLATRHSIESIRNFHIQMAYQAIRRLEKPVISQAEFDSRLINGVMFAANPNRIEEAKSLLNKALYEVAELMSQDKCTEVYFVGTHLYPVTKI